MTTTEEGKTALRGLAYGKRIQTARLLLLAAAAYMRRFGWRQGANTRGSFGRPPGPCCLIAAIVEMAPDPGQAGVRRAAYDHIERVIGARDIPRWNDTHGRTVEEVLDVLTRAAEAA